jgi:hypothetical protein
MTSHLANRACSTPEGAAKIVKRFTATCGNTVFAANIDPRQCGDKDKKVKIDNPNQRSHRVKTLAHDSIVVSSVSSPVSGSVVVVMSVPAATVMLRTENTTQYANTRKKNALNADMPFF